MLKLQCAQTAAVMCRKSNYNVMYNYTSYNCRQKPANMVGCQPLKICVFSPKRTGVGFLDCVGLLNSVVGGHLPD